MALDSRVKGSLAWLGLVVVLAVPAADLVLGKPGAQIVPAVPDTATALKLPKAATTQAALSDGEDPVAKRLASGKGLPSYISDRKPDEVAGTTKPVLAAPQKPAAVAAVPQAVLTPPLPLPRDARPKGTLVANTGDEPLVLDEATVRAREQSAAVEPFPLSDGGEAASADARSADWNTESLADYLVRKGLISDNSGDALESYDPDGFYLDEGPNGTRKNRQQLQSFDWFLF